MDIRLSDHFTYKKLLRFVIPSVGMMIFTSIYGIVDGLFVSNFVGKTAFASLNLMMPFIMILSSIGFMFGTGGSAIIAKTLGEQNQKKANEYFSLLIITILISGIIIGIIGILSMPSIASLLGATEKMKPYSILYGRMLMLTIPFFMLQTSFQSLFVTAGKPKLGFIVTVFAGCMNIVMDFLLVGVLKMGLFGAALATNSSEVIGGLIPIFYFIKNNDSLLKFAKPSNDFDMILKAGINGSSEFVSDVSRSLVGIVYNIQLLKYAQENGVAAYGAIMYVNFIFVAIYIGYSTGSAPLISFNFGAQNHDELKNLFKKSLIIIMIFGIMMSCGSLLISRVLMESFVGYDIELFELTLHGFRIYCINYLICGFNIYGSGFFTALNNGKISAMISFFRTLLFQLGSLLLLPFYFGIDGIWSAVVVADIFSCIMTCYFIKKYKDRYRYL